MGIVRLIVWITFSVVLATVFPGQKSPTVSAADDTTLTGAASSLGTALSDTYTELAAIKYEEYQLAYKALRMSLGFLTNLLGRSINGLGTTLDLAGNGLTAARSYTETGTGYLVDAAQGGLRSASTAVGAAGESTKGYGNSLLDLPKAGAAAGAGSGK
ncbi:uncharacterized protein LOC135848619 [Planococcus citri]|uniref:uncharacterized protein LOC135848619 n=1 Tax=Planococcus citri TaxID=170843 RepID=UPI0031F9417D